MGGGGRLSPQLRHPAAPPKTPTSTFPEAPDLPRGICQRLRYWQIHQARWRRRRASGALGRARGVTGSVPQRGSAPRRLFQILGQNTGRDFSTLNYYNLAENSKSQSPFWPYSSQQHSSRLLIKFPIPKSSTALSICPNRTVSSVLNIYRFMCPMQNVL